MLICRNHYQTLYTSTRLLTIFNRQNSVINTLTSSCVVCLFMAAFLLNISYCTYYIKRSLPFSLRSRYVECNMHRAVYSNTRPYNITPKGFPCVVCLVMHEGSLWRQHKFSTQLILAPHPSRSLCMNIHIETI